MNEKEAGRGWNGELCSSARAYDRQIRVIARIRNKAYCNVMKGTVGRALSTGINLSDSNRSNISKKIDFYTSVD